MPVDPSIALNVKPFQLANPLEQFGQFQQAQAAMSQNRLADLVFGEKQREASESAQMNMLYKGAMGKDGKLDRNILMGSAASAGLGSRIPGLQKAFLDMDKDQAITGKNKADADKVAQETASHQFEIAGQLASAWAQNPSVTQEQIRNGLAAAAHSKVISPEIYQAKLAELDKLPGDSASLNQWALGTLQQVMTAKDSMGFIKPDANTVANNTTSAANNAATNATTRATNAATVGATIRGQNLTDARARELGQQGQYDAERGVLVDKRTGVARPVVGSDGKPLQGGGKMTEDQAKATGWLVQAENAWKNMQAVGLSKDGNPTDAAKPGRVETALSTIPFGMGEPAANSWRNADRQKFLHGASSLSEALLRAATGAGVNKDEAVQKVREITPVWGDDDATIKQKMDSIPLYIESLKVRSGPGAAKAATVLAAPAAVPPKAKQGQAGIKFLGFE